MGDFPKFKLGQCVADGDDLRTAWQFISRDVAVQLHGEQTVKWLETGQIAGSGAAHHPNGHLLLYTIDESIRDAAPDLLAALEGMLDAWVKLGNDSPSMPGFEKTVAEVARAAIAKALA